MRSIFLSPSVNGFKYNYISAVFNNALPVMYEL
ncbi:MAG: hypothetical protein K0S91_81 [Nitrososphaeraceae archaeon]|jgi:hypothetical protein|nr:hypothetical protein [Nitrososphaeraceae archaeon]